MSFRFRGTFTVMIVLLLLSAVVPLGCTAPQSQVEAELSLSSTPLLGKPVEITYTFALPEDYKWYVENATTRILLPEGFELVETDVESREELIVNSVIDVETYEDLVAENVSERAIREELSRGLILIEDPLTGDKVFYERFTVIEQHGDMVGGKTYTVHATIKAVKTGDWIIKGRTRYSPYPRSINGGADNLYITITEDSAEVYQKRPAVSLDGEPMYDTEHPQKPPVVIPFDELPPLPENLPSPPRTSSSNATSELNGIDRFTNPLTPTNYRKCG